MTKNQKNVKLPTSRTSCHKISKPMQIHRFGLVLFTGALSASEKSMTHVLTHSPGGRVLCLMVGGARESFKCKPGNYEIILKSRKGFVRIALKTG